MTRIAESVLPKEDDPYQHVDDPDPRRWDRVVPFRDPRAALNDEIVLNGPGVDIPTVALSRYPYPEYHTTADCPAILDEAQLCAAVDVLEQIVRIAATDWVPRRRFKGSIFLSAYGLWVDWRTHPRLNAAMEQIMLRLEGDRSVFDIAQQVGLPFEEVYHLIDQFREQGLVGEVP